MFVYSDLKNHTSIVGNAVQSSAIESAFGRVACLTVTNLDLVQGHHEFNSPNVHNSMDLDRSLLKMFLQLLRTHKRKIEGNNIILNVSPVFPPSCLIIIFLSFSQLMSSILLLFLIYHTRLFIILNIFVFTNYLIIITCRTSAKTLF